MGHIEFHDADMRLAWAQAQADELVAAGDPERIARERRRLIAWVAARTAVG